jgi:hypothetical protein
MRAPVEAEVVRVIPLALLAVLAEAPAATEVMRQLQLA